MRRLWRWFLAAAVCGVLAVAIAVGVTMMWTPGSVPGRAAKQVAGYGGIEPPDQMLRVPDSYVYPGGNPSGLIVDMKNPIRFDASAVSRGKQDFEVFNCSGCHGPNGGGGMGPSLSNDTWLHGASPGQIYLSIVYGRSNGMPAWGAMLPDRTVWELVAYIKSISKKPGDTFGDTTSLVPQQPSTQQVPAGQVTALDPWNYTRPMPVAGEKGG